ncbi:MAG: hypothetical protein CSA35_00155 [Dethiosulfovibrio peptidovorans]|nr:MAG: hypothetical protein CSA35_00155 [Dethiosulfovibrio peptidovorans]
MTQDHIREYLEEKFTRDPQTGALEVRLRFKSYEDLFEPLDGAPYGEKNLSSALVRVLLHLFEEIPLEYPYVLVFEFTGVCRVPRMEERCAKDFYRWCHYRSALARKRVQKNTKDTLLYACIAAILIGASSLMGKFYPSSMLERELLHQVLTVGWWIFAWQAGSNLLLNWGHIRAPLRQFTRLQTYPVRFEYF